MNTDTPMLHNDSDDPHYSVFAGGEWGDEFTGTFSETTDNDYAGTLGVPITNITLGAKGISEFRIRTRKKSRWSDYSKAGFNKENTIGDGTPITGIEIVGSGYVYAVHIKGGEWLPSVLTADKRGVNFIGCAVPIDGFWIEKL